MGIQSPGSPLHVMDPSPPPSSRSVALLYTRSAVPDASIRSPLLASNDSQAAPNGLSFPLRKVTSQIDRLMKNGTEQTQTSAGPRYETSGVGSAGAPPFSSNGDGGSFGGDGREGPEPRPPRLPFPTSEREDEYQHYFELAFNIAVYPASVHDNEQRQKQLLKSVEQRGDDETRSHRKQHQDTIGRVEADINEKAAELENEKAHLVALRGRADILNTEREETEAKLVETETDLDAAFQTLSKERADLRTGGLQDHLETLKTAVESILEQKDEILDDAVDALSTLQDKAQKVYTKQMECLGERREALNKQLSAVSERTRRHRKRGFDGGAAYVLLLFAFVALAGSSFALSAFTAEVELGPESTASLLLGRLLALASLVHSTGFILSTLVWTGLLLSITGVVYGITKVRLDRLKQESTARSAPEAITEIGIRLSERVRIHATYATWLDAVPYLFALGLGYILLAAAPEWGSDVNQEFESMLNAAYGQTVGPLLALAFAGVALAARMFFDSRLADDLRTGSDPGPAARLAAVGWSFLAFVVLSFLFLVYGLLHDFGITRIADVTPKATISLAMYSLCVLGTGIGIAFGVPVMRLFHQERTLQREADELDQKISGPLPEELQQIAKGLREKIGAEYRELSETIKRKNEHACNLLDQLFLTEQKRRSLEAAKHRSRVEEGRRRQRAELWRRFTHLVRRITPWVSAPEPTDDASVSSRRRDSYVHLTDIETLFFPRLVRRIRKGERRRSDLEDRIRELSEKIETVEARNTPEEVATKDRIRDVKQSIKQYRNVIQDHNEQWQETKKQIERRRVVRETGARNGYHLGITYRPFYTGGRSLQTVS